MSGHYDEPIFITGFDIWDVTHSTRSNLNITAHMGGSIIYHWGYMFSVLDCLFVLGICRGRVGIKVYVLRVRIYVFKGSALIKTGFC